MDRLHQIETYWSDRAATFDDDPDHGLADPLVRVAWAARLKGWIGEAPARVVDVGCGTGSLAILLAEAGYDVIGIDLSSAMLARARSKADQAGLTIEFHVGDASDPDFRDGSFDAVLCRHVVWALVDPAAAVRRWARLLNRRGRLVLIEGQWFDASQEQTPSSELPWDGGIPAAELTAELSVLFERVDHHPLSDDDKLWGRPVSDERYALVATRPFSMPAGQPRPPT